MEQGRAYPLGQALPTLSNDPYVALHLAPVAKLWRFRATHGQRGQVHTYQSTFGDEGSKGKGKSKKGSAEGARLAWQMAQDSTGEPICGR